MGLALITKKMKRLFGILTAIFIGITFLWLVFISPAVSGATKCFIQETKNREENSVENQIKLNVENEQIICQSDAASIGKLSTCLDKSRLARLGFIIDTNYPKFKKTFSDAISNHNHFCTQSLLVPLIDY